MTRDIRFPWRVYSRVLMTEILLVVIVLSLAGLGVRSFFRAKYVDQIDSQLRDSLVALSVGLPKEHTTAEAAQWCATRAKDTHIRFTWIAADGIVICDSHHDTATMENHASRPEVVQARAEGFGRSVRHSDTLNEEMIYGAIAVKPGDSILRGAFSLEDMRASLQAFDRALILLVLCVAGLMTALAAWAGRSLVFPIGRILRKTQAMVEPPATSPGDRLRLDDELGGEEAYGEWSDLEANLDSIRKDLENKVEQLTREREEQAILMSAISEGILAVDREERPLFYNSRFALLADTTALRRGSRLWELFREPEILDAFRLALNEGTASTVQGLPLGPDPARRFYAVSVSPLKRKGGRIYGAVGIFHDVTELKSAEQIRIDFVANVSHELRTPLTSIKGYTDTLLADAEKGIAPEKAFLDVIRRNTDRLMSLINDLLDLSSIESSGLGGGAVAKAAVDTREISARVLQNLQSRIQERKQEASMRIDAPVVYADTRRLEQVLVNLVDNASKYTPPGGRIEIAWEKAGSNRILLKVIDTGPGIPSEHHARLFERFYRVDKGRSREMGGTGLGLAIVKHIVQNHGGSVWVESQVGHGSTFVCSFPG